MKAYMNEKRSALARMQAAAKYMPSTTRVLFVAEAPPDDVSRYFYFEHVTDQDWLWLGLMKGLYPHEFGESNQERPRKKYWLERFRDNGFQLIDAVKDPITSTNVDRNGALQGSQTSLLSEIHEVCPEQIVLIKTNVHKALFESFRGANLNVVNDVPLPFPCSGRQREFHDGLRRLIDNGRLNLGFSVVGVDGCSAGWIAFKVDIARWESSVELIDLSGLLQKRPSNLACLAIDIPIGLLNGSRACDSAARQLLGWPRRNSVFSPPCREALSAATYSDACNVNSRVANKKISQQAWGIARKIKEVDDAIRTRCQEWVYEIHPEVSFWAMAGKRPMEHRKKSAAGCTERLTLLRPVFDQIDDLLANRPSGVGKDDLLDAAAAAWSALRIASGEGQRVSAEQEDSLGLRACIWY